MLRGLPSGLVACSDTACGLITAIAAPSTSSAATTNIEPPSTANTPPIIDPVSRLTPARSATYGRSRVRGDLDEGAILHDMTVLDDHDPVRQCERVDRIMSHQYSRALERGQMLAELAAHLDLGGGVESRQRFVQQQDLRIRGKCPRQRDPLGLAA